MSGTIRSALSYLRRSAGGNIWSTAFARSKVPDMRRGKNLQMQVTLGPAMQVTTVPIPDWAHGYTIYPSVEAWDAVNETPVPAGLTVTEVPVWAHADNAYVEVGDPTWPPATLSNVNIGGSTIDVTAFVIEGWSGANNGFARIDTSWLATVNVPSVSLTFTIHDFDPESGNEDDMTLAVQAYAWESGALDETDVATTMPETGVIGTRALSSLETGEVVTMAMPPELLNRDGYTGLRFLLVSDEAPAGYNHISLNVLGSGYPVRLSITHDGGVTPWESGQAVVVRRTDTGIVLAEGPVAGGAAVYPPEEHAGYTTELSLTDSAPGALKQFSDLGEGNSLYTTRLALLRFDTSHLAGTPVAASLALTAAAVVRDDDNRDLLVESFTWDSDVTVEDAYTSALPTSPLATWPLDTGVAAGDVVTIALGNPAAWLSRDGYTGFRLHLSGDAPTGTNEFRFAAFGTRGNDDDWDPPALTVTMEEGSQYVIPFSAWRVGRRAPAETASRHTLEDVANRELRIVSLTDNATVQLDVY